MTPSAACLRAAAPRDGGAERFCRRFGDRRRAAFPPRGLSLRPAFPPAVFGGRDRFPRRLLRNRLGSGFTAAGSGSAGGGGISTACSALGGCGACTPAGAARSPRRGGGADRSRLLDGGGGLCLGRVRVAARTPDPDDRDGEPEPDHPRNQSHVASRAAPLVRACARPPGTFWRCTSSTRAMTSRVSAATFAGPPS